MGNSWTNVTVAELAAESPHALATGPFGSAIGSDTFRTSGVPVIRGSNLSTDVGRRLVEDDYVYLDEAKASEFSRSQARPGDLVFTCWGTIGQVGLVDARASFDRYIVSNKQMKLTPDARKASSLFLYYVFSGPLLSEAIRSSSIGSSVPGFNLGQLRSVSVALPPLPEQRAIAHILGTLDDKIELNRRTNETLEAMARALFKSWFVDFDPVHAKKAGRKPEGMDAETAALFPDDFEDSEMGKIPRGWRCGALSSVCSDSRSTVYPNEIDPETPYVGLEHVPQRKMVLEVWGKAASISSQKSRFQEADVLFGKLRPYFHKVAVAHFAGVCSTDIVVVRARVPQFFGLTLGHLSSDAFVAYTTAGSDGTRMPRTSWDRMSKYGIVIPGEASARAHSQHVRGLVQRQVATVGQSQTLAALRDALLPQLLSGSLRVPEAMRLVEKAL